MFTTRNFLFGVIAGLFALDASAQDVSKSPSERQTVSADSACPRRPLSIYFASGQSTASPQAQALITKIGETATTCQPDRVDLIARINTAVDGQRALAVALERLNTVAADLVSHGLPADHIRVAALSAPQGPPLNQIDVLFSTVAKDGLSPEDTPKPASSSDRVVIEEAI